MRGDGRLQVLDPPPTDVYEIASLAGGGRRMVDAALAALFTRDLLALETPSKGRSTVGAREGHRKDELHVIERQVWQALPKGRKAEKARQREGSTHQRDWFRSFSRCVNGCNGRNRRAHHPHVATFTCRYPLFGCQLQRRMRNRLWVVAGAAVVEAAVAVVEAAVAVAAAAEIKRTLARNPAACGEPMTLGEVPRSVLG